MDNCYGPVVLSQPGLEAIDCQACGFVHIYPLPDQATVDAMYSSAYYQEHYPDQFEKEKREWWYWQLAYRERLNTFAELLGGDALHMLLDYGAGAGWFVRAAVDDPRFLAAGVELNENAIMFASSELEIELWRKVQWLPWQYTATHASLVLEHLIDPTLFLKQAYHTLRPGGVLCLIVPNEFNPLQQKLRAHGHSPLDRHHINYFTPESLESLATGIGFRIVRREATYPMEWFALNGLDYVNRPGWGKIAHWMRMIYEWAILTLAPWAMRDLRQIWAKRRIGREIILWLRK